MGSGFAKRKKQARAVQEQFARVQEEIAAVTAEGSAGGMVSLTLNGDHELLAIKLKPECVDKDDIEALEDLIKVAYNDALEKLKEKTNQKMPDLGSLSGFMGL
ncbi:MAG: YbaB/EbfC family nucleoid-associated protein [Verrucomicrobia bacterium]|nr:YbaB/EbfC family nucleoid-associated protein [Verrucomicrobiota bacterium]